MSKQFTRQSSKSLKQTRQDRRRDEQRKRDEERQRSARNKRLWMISGGISVLLIGAIVLFVFFSGRSQAQQPAVFDPANPTVSGLSCDPTEQLAVHYHAHISLFVDGQPVQIPSQIGIANDCFYWTHVHDTTGVIHIEAPQDTPFTVGQFLSLWKNQFPDLGNGYPGQLDVSGWTVYVNGKIYTGDLHKIVFKSHMLITMGFNSPNMKPDTTYSWGSL